MYYLYWNVDWGVNVSKIFLKNYRNVDIDQKSDLCNNIYKISNIIKLQNTGVIFYISLYNIV